MRERFIFHFARAGAQRLPTVDGENGKLAPLPEEVARLRSAPRSCGSRSAARAFASKVSGVW